jgi:pyridinium-3,5-bisthiocarboxylic acid mononucleotide nickel chelatase
VTIAWFNCQSGISGDMALAALLDAGASLESVRAAIRTVIASGWSLELDRVARGGVRAVRAVVSVDDDAGHRSASQILSLIDSAGLPSVVESVALNAVRALATAEAKIHEQQPERVHLHEVGGIDTIVDVVGTAAAMHLLGIEAVYASPVGSGAGVVQTRHGPIPVPAPAVVELLRHAPLRILDTTDELVTPTGAALLVAMGARFDGPALWVSGQGFGAGSVERPERPNVLQVVIGENAPQLREELVLLETNLDDATPEVLAYTVERALAAGAADAWLVPAVMKKGRPGVTVHVLVQDHLATALEELLLTETGSLGVRRHRVERRALERDWVEVPIGEHRVRVKRGLIGRRVVSMAAEYEDARAVAQAQGRSLRTIMTEALEALRSRPPNHDDDRKG